MSTLQEKIALLSVENKAKMDSAVKTALSKEKAENKALATMDVAKRTVHLARIRQQVMEEFIANNTVETAIPGREFRDYGKQNLAETKAFLDSHIIVCRPDTQKAEKAEKAPAPKAEKAEKAPAPKAPKAEKAPKEETPKEEEVLPNTEYFGALAGAKVDSGLKLNEDVKVGYAYNISNVACVLLTKKDIFKGRGESRKLVGFECLAKDTKGVLFNTRISVYKVGTLYTVKANSVKAVKPNPRKYRGVEVPLKSLASKFDANSTISIKDVAKLLSIPEMSTNAISATLKNAAKQLGWMKGVVKFLRTPNMCMKYGPQGREYQTVIFDSQYGKGYRLYRKNVETLVNAFNKALISTTKEESLEAVKAAIEDNTKKLVPFFALCSKESKEVAAKREKTAKAASVTALKKAM